ncbi:hypothetical protein HELRODRAFT_76360 [Helobdella robusta]|uniref:Neurotransmitter-gated ion-channel ligand-binding domain-containing protein n=1 Tax=Helobdella robusta TaxID=6412 RepID=T1G2I9_HELRO|nr:hypothetical protein HELRODRAFT_76360 [Helobdella robusta]ESO07125.1 hypothetical protein HELRODRAFT_76360 [Helobdella robusta]
MNVELTSADKVFGDIFDHERYRAQLFSNGTVSYSTSGKTTTFCQLNLQYFPFDSQACYLEIFSWTYSESQLSLEPFGKSVDLENFNGNGQWNLTRVEVGAFVDIIPLEIDREYYSVARFVFYINRKPLYHVVTLIIPSTIMSFLVIFVYLLPADSSEKVSLSITILLAYSVFQLGVADNMPKTSNIVPYITVYVSFVMFFASVSLLSTIFVLILHFHVNYTRPPKWLQTLWNVIVSTVDKMFLIIYTVLNIFACVLFLAVLPAIAPKQVEPETMF